MGFFNLFKKKEKNVYVEQVQLMSEYGTQFVSWNGKVYESDIVRACIRPKVKAIGKLTAKHIRKTIEEDGSLKIEVNPSFYIKQLLEYPNPIMSGQDLQEKMANQLCLNNNAFVLISRNEDGLPTALYPICPQSAAARFAGNQTFIKFVMNNGKMYEFNYEDIIHIRDDFNDNDLFGSPLAPALAPLLNVVTISDQGIISAIKNSAVIRWLLKFTNSMRPDDLRTKAEEFAEDFLKTEKGTGVAAVDAKADAKQIEPHDYVPDSSQTSATEQRIYALFNTNEKIVHSNATEEERMAYFDAEIEPVLEKIRKEYTRKLFSIRQRGFGNYITLEAGTWDSASTKTKLDLVALVDRGALTPNEWRAAFNLAPIEGGDQPIRRLDTAAVAEEGGNE